MLKIAPTQGKPCNIFMHKNLFFIVSSDFTVEIESWCPFGEYNLGYYNTKGLQFYGKNCKVKVQNMRVTSHCELHKKRMQIYPKKWLLTCHLDLDSNIPNIFRFIL